MVFQAAVRCYFRWQCDDKIAMILPFPLSTSTRGARCRDRRPHSYRLFYELNWNFNYTSINIEELSKCSDFMYWNVTEFGLETLFCLIGEVESCSNQHKTDPLSFSITFQKRLFFFFVFFWYLDKKVLLGSLFYH